MAGRHRTRASHGDEKSSPVAPTRASEDAGRPNRPSRFYTLWPGLVLAALVVGCFAPVANCNFIWDDNDYVTENRQLRTLDGLQKIWLEPRATPQYYPLVHTTFWCEYQLWQLNPLGYHLVNVAIHAATAILLWRLLRQLSVPGSWWIAAIFAIHPVQVESVAWITERKNVLSGMCYLLAAGSYVRWAKWGQGATSEKPSWTWYGLALAFYVAALLSKTVTVSLPAALLLVAWWKDPLSLRRHVVALIPFFAIGIPMAMLTAWLERNQVGASGEAFHYGLAERIFLAGRIPWFYAQKLLWPSELSFIYPRWNLEAFRWWWLLWTAATLALVIGLAAATQKWGSRLGRGPLVAVLFFGGTLFPALGFFNVYPFKYSFVADHFQYLASIGIIALVAGTIAYWAEQDRRLRVVAGVVGSCVLVALGVVTYGQVGVYESRGMLWADVLLKNPDSALALQGLAAERAAVNNFREAKTLYERAIPLTIDSHDRRNVLYDLGQTLYRAGDEAGAKRAWRQTLEIDGAQVGVAEKLGLLATKEQDWPHAEEYWRIVVTHDRRHALAWQYMAIALSAQGKHADAEPNYREAVSLAPKDAGLRLNWARCLASLGRSGDAAMQAQLAASSSDPRIAADAKRFLKQIEEQK
jgi:Tfp pilus assembly protein PilF